MEVDCHEVENNGFFGEKRFLIKKLKRRMDKTDDKIDFDWCHWKITSTYCRLFINQGEKTHMVVNRFEKFLEYHRGKVETSKGLIKHTYERNGEMKINELTA
jgi:hypothetical protein